MSCAIYVVSDISGHATHERSSEYSNDHLYHATHMSGVTTYTADHLYCATHMVIRMTACILLLIRGQVNTRMTTYITPLMSGAR